MVDHLCVFCERLQELFELLKGLFGRLGGSFSHPLFVGGLI